MPRRDGSGPQGMGRPGRGRVSCRNQNDFEVKMTKYATNNGKPYHGFVHGEDGSQHIEMYEFRLEDLKEKRAELEKELKWLDERIKELEKANENSNPGN